MQIFNSTFEKDFNLNKFFLKSVFLISLLFISINFYEMVVERSYYEYSDWLINYQGGFTRRGLIGEFLYILYSITNIRLDLLLYTFVISLYIIFFYFLFKILDKASASKHIDAGAKKVIISAPAKEVDFTVVQGVNSKDLKKEHNIISNGSCTTNCLAPVAMVLENTFGIEYGYMTTIHSYTGDQKLLDTLHKDLRRARASGDAMIPTSTGAAKAMSLVLPSLKGKLDGTAIRVPTPNVSLIDLTFVPKKEVTAESINEAMNKAANGALKGILAINSAPLVSKDFNHNPHSSIFDLTQTQVIKGKFSRVLSWYDNEWGFSNRMCDTTIQIASLI